MNIKQANDYVGLYWYTWVENMRTSLSIAKGLWLIYVDVTLIL